MPKPNYAEVRARVGSAFAEKAHELADAVAVGQGLSKEAARLPGIVVAAFLRCFALCMVFMVLMAAKETYSICWEAIAFHDLLGV